MTAIQVESVVTRSDLRAFVRLPWRIYRGDRNWVPPLIAERMAYLDPRRGPFYEHADVALFLARRDGQPLGTIAAFVNHSLVQRVEQPVGGFGFFETVDDYAVAEQLLDTASAWLRARGMRSMRGPTSFTANDCPGVLIEGADCPPVMFEAHTPPYYRSFLERYGMEKYDDLFAWRAFRSQIGQELANARPELARVADAARHAAGVTVRAMRMGDWASEIEAARQLFNVTLEHLPDHVALTKAEFQRLADGVRPFLNPALALFAEVDGKPVGFCVAIPDVNRVLMHLNGRLSPFDLLRLKRMIRRIDVVSFKLMGVLEEYRRRGIDALLYLEAVKAMYDAGYEWLDGSLTSEFNVMITMIAGRLGAERYKVYRIYQRRL